MLNAILTFGVLGGGMWASARLIPGQWLLIVALGAALGFLLLILGGLLPTAASPAPVHSQSAGTSGRGGKSLYGIAFLVAAMGLSLVWVVLSNGDMAALPIGMMSTAVFLGGACLGFAAYLITLAWKPVK